MPLGLRVCFDALCKTAQLYDIKFPVAGQMPDNTQNSYGIKEFRIITARRDSFSHIGIN